MRLKPVARAASTQDKARTHSEKNNAPGFLIQSSSASLVYLIIYYIVVTCKRIENPRAAQSAETNILCNII